MTTRNRPLDNQDRKIMRELQKNARLSNAELAELVGMSTTACWNRTRQLETEGYIRGYVALLDQQKLGFADVVLLEVTLDRHDDDALARFGAELATLTEVLEAPHIDTAFSQARQTACCMAVVTGRSYQPKRRLFICWELFF